MNTKVINYGEFDFNSSTVIKPKLQQYDEHDSSRVRKPYVICSTDRNMMLYPTPDNYVVELVSDIQDVLGFELVVSNLAFNPYNVRKYKHTLYVTCNGKSEQVELTEGLYTTATLCTELTTRLNEVFPGANFDVTYKTSSLKLEIMANLSFTIKNVLLEGNNKLYPCNSIAKALGFGCNEYTAEYNVAYSKYHLIPDYALQLDTTERDNIIICIDTMQVNQGNTNAINKSFAVISNQAYESTQRVIKKNFNPPLARLSKISIKFYDVDGNPYDFQNRDHVLQFMIETHKHTRRYHAYTAD